MLPLHHDEALAAQTYCAATAGASANAYRNRIGRSRSNCKRSMGISSSATTTKSGAATATTAKAA